MALLYRRGGLAVNRHDRLALSVFRATVIRHLREPIQGSLVQLYSETKRPVL